MAADKSFEEYEALAKAALTRFRDHTLGHFIDGELVEAQDGRTYENLNPATEEVIGAVADATAADMGRDQ